MNKIVLLFLLLGSLANAEVFVREYTYNASENDSKVSARKAALRQLQLLLIEEVGITVRSNYFKEVSLKNDTASKTINDKYESFSQAITKSKILEQTWNGEKFYIKVEMDIDPNGIAKAIDTISNPPMNKKEKCYAQEKDFQARIKDLTDKEKVNAIVADAIKHPFSLPCNRWHFDIIYKFIRYDINNAQYKEFLLSTLESIKLPSEDKRASYIIDYLRQEDGIQKEQWAAVLQALKRSSSSQIYTMLRTSFSKQNKYTREFLDEFLDEAKDQKVGLPKPLGFSRIARTTIGVFDDDKSDIFEIYYDYNADDLDPKDDKTLYTALESRYFKEPTPKRLKMMKAYYKRQQASDKLSNTLFSLLKQFKREAQENETLSQDFTSFVKDTQDVMAESFPLCTYRSGIQDRISFMLRFNIASSITPTPQESAKKLFDEDHYVQMQHAKYLNLMQEDARPVKAKVIKRLRRIERDRFSGTTNMTWDLIDILGNIKTTNSEALELLIKALSSTKHKVPDHAVSALKRIGSPAVDSLISMYDTQEDYVKLRIIKILANSKNTNDKVLPFLKSVPQTNGWFKDAIEDALEPA